MAEKIKDLCMLVDQSLCVGCEACTAVCKQVYDVTKGLFRTKIKLYESGTFPESISVYQKQACMHCTDAACVAACPTGACHKTEEGLTLIDRRTCITCNYCIANCPYGAIQFDRSNGYMEKCTLCRDRLEQGMVPLCAEVCTTRAIRFGTRQEMLAYGERRVAQLQGQGFGDAMVYGESEMAGLKVLLVLRESPEKYNLPADPQIPVGTYIWKYITRPLGGLAALALIGGFIANLAQSKKMKQPAGKPDSVENS